MNGYVSFKGHKITNQNVRYRTNYFQHKHWVTTRVRFKQFSIYFENSLKKFREELDKISPELPTTISYQNSPNDLQYTDDADFITKDE